MAFQKRTWFARIGTGLNKFIIGAKDGEGKQTLTNAPDSVTQQGDVISAENLNDFEDRIEDGFNGVMPKLTKIWENPNPTSDFVSQTIDLGQVANDLYIQCKRRKDTYEICEYKHIYTEMTASSTMVLSFSNITITASSVGVVGFSSRNFIAWTDETTKVMFDDAKTAQWLGSGPWEYTTSNGNYIPTAIYKVGGIYNMEA